MPHIRMVYKISSFSSSKNLKEVNLRKKFTVKLIYCSCEVLFYSTHSFPTSSLPRYNIFIAPRSCSFQPLHSNRSFFTCTCCSWPDNNIISYFYIMFFWCVLQNHFSSLYHLKSISLQLFIIIGLSV